MGTKEQNPNPPSKVKAVVIGVILLSTFLYSLILLVLIRRNAAVSRRKLAEETPSPGMIG